LYRISISTSTSTSTGRLLACSPALASAKVTREEMKEEQNIFTRGG